MTAPHRLIKAERTSPLGKRIRLRCQKCREQMDKPGDPGTATDWLQQHAGTDKTEAARMIRDAERWPS